MALHVHEEVSFRREYGDERSGKGEFSGKSSCGFNPICTNFGGCNAGNEGLITELIFV